MTFKSQAAGIFSTDYFLEQGDFMLLAAATLGALIGYCRAIQDRKWAAQD
ncbi:MAG: hypothetical protein IT342_23620 [Candidatus Melainabacteria bacterium]|nr:hypothetical protein [Candidatus Melainabacteria bacterium]